jgi:hypothetical protein
MELRTIILALLSVLPAAAQYVPPVGGGGGPVTGGAISGTTGTFTGTVQVSNTLSVVSVSAKIVTKTTTYLATTLDHTILADMTAAAFTVTLPASPVWDAPSSTGQILHIKAIGSANLLTVAGNGKLIDGASTWTTGVPNTSVTLHFDGTAWRII